MRVPWERETAKYGSWYKDARTRTSFVILWRWSGVWGLGSGSLGPGAVCTGTVEARIGSFKMITVEARESVTITIPTLNPKTRTNTEKQH